MADCRADRAEDDTVPEAAVTPSRNIEFGAQGALKDIVARRRLDVVKSSQARQRILDPSKRLLFMIRPRCVLALFAQQRLQKCSGRSALGRPTISLLDGPNHPV